MRIGDWHWGPGLGMRIGNWDQDFGSGIMIGDWAYESEIGALKLEIEDLEFGIGN